jgi:MFS family permease
MLIRASLGMAIAISLTGMAQDVYQLVGLRLLTGFLGGYASGSFVLVATQTPKARSAWALGMLSFGIMAGNLAGPLLGGVLPQLVGLRATFLAAGAVIFVAFVGTIIFIREEKRPTGPTKVDERGGFAAGPEKGPLLAMLFTGMLLMFANMSIEPIITVYVPQLVAEPAHVTIMAGLVMSAAALGSILCPPRAWASWQTASAIGTSSSAAWRPRLCC